MAQAMEDLEGDIGTARMETMGSDELFAAVIATHARSKTSAAEHARLMDWYANNFAACLARALYDLPLEHLEVLLCLRKEQERRIVVADVGAHIDTLLSRPQEIYSVPSRRFEEVVAYALSKSGYDEVQLTRQTRDGGFDIAASRSAPTREMLIVECKRFDASRKVGRPVLDRLLGVLQQQKANQALLATTSFFSRDALDLLHMEPWRLQGMDFKQVMELLRKARESVSGRRRRQPNLT
jgi:hypothetical protein